MNIVKSPFPRELENALMFKKLHILIYCVYVWVHMSYDICVEVRTLFEGVGSLLPPREFLELKSGY